MSAGGELVKAFLDTIGITNAGTAAAAGFSGGVVHIFWYKKTRPFDAIGAIACGVLTAIWVAPQIAKYVSVSEAFVGFFIGLGGVQGLAPLFAMLRERIFGRTGDKPNASS